LSKNIHKFAALLLLSAPSVIAQVAPPTQWHTVSQVMDFWVTNTEQLIIPAADAMPDAQFSFAPSHGEFSGVRDIQDVVGTYASAEAHAGASKSAKAQAMTKGEVSLALAGKGAGWDLGIAFGKFTISGR